MTSHLDSHGSTDFRPEILLCVQTGYGIKHDEYNIICGIAHVRTHIQKRQHYHAKTTIAKLYLSPILNLKAFYGRWMGYVLNFVGHATMYHTYS